MPRFPQPVQEWTHHMQGKLDVVQSCQPKPPAQGTGDRGSDRGHLGDPAGTAFRSLEDRRGRAERKRISQAPPPGPSPAGAEPPGALEAGRDCGAGVTRDKSGAQDKGQRCGAELGTAPWGCGRRQGWALCQGAGCKGCPWLLQAFPMGAA